MASSTPTNVVSTIKTTSNKVSLEFYPLLNGAKFQSPAKFPAIVTLREARRQKRVKRAFQIEVYFVSNCTQTSVRQFRVRAFGTSAIIAMQPAGPLKEASPVSDSPNHQGDFWAHLLEQSCNVYLLQSADRKTSNPVSRLTELLSNCGKRNEPG